MTKRKLVWQLCTYDLHYKNIYVATYLWEIWNKIEDILKISKCSKKSKNFCILDNLSTDDSKIINAYGLFDKVVLKENK